MIIGIPRERKSGEKRVALTPDGVSELVGLGHTVRVETGAGLGSGFHDDEFRAAGASLVAALEDVWAADLLVKVKEPAEEELQYFRRGLTVFSFLHPAAFPTQTKTLLEKGVTGISYDTLMLDSGELPILEPMSIIAGKLAVQCGAWALQSEQGGRGVLLGGAPGVAPATVLVIGAGSAGGSAARTAIGMGADVRILDIEPDRLLPFTTAPYRATTLYSSPRVLERELLQADLVIGAVLRPGALAPKLISRTMLRTMKQGAVFLDISIDQGGIAETSRPTTVSEPVFVEEGVVHCCVPNFPALVPRTSTLALTSVTIGWLRRLVQQGVPQALRNSVPLRRALVSCKGKLTNSLVGEALNIPAVQADEALQLLP